MVQKRSVQERVITWSITQVLVFTVFTGLYISAPLALAQQGDPKSQKEPIVLQGSITTHVETVDQSDSGPFTVEVASGLKIFDGQRKKSIPVEACYPKQSGKYPVIVISHGAITSARDYRPLAAFWASHGYVCLLPTHEDALVLHSHPNEKVSLFKLAGLSKVSDKELEGRRLDMVKVLDGLATLEERIPGLSGKIDPSHIAAVGHHAGAHCAGMLGGVSSKKIVGTPVDARVNALIEIVGQNWRLPSVSEQSWKAVDIPAMVVSANVIDKDISSIRSGLKTALTSAPPGNKYFVTVDMEHKLAKPSPFKAGKILKNSNIELLGWHPLRKHKRAASAAESASSNAESNNPTVGDADLNELAGSDIVRILGIGPMLSKPNNATGRMNFVMSVTLPFLDAYLKNDPQAKQRLESVDRQNYGEEIVTSIERL
ncbi:MAG: hypothetical protein K2Z81_16545 [Cyanobacteria bacterium]|nr:hypothetical protein [Cyanobacteriota bacterium]